MLRHLAATGLNLLIVALIVLAGLIGWGAKTFHDPGPLEVPAVVEIPRGAGLEAISRRLAEAGAIRHPAIFRIGVRYLGVGDRLRFGVYEIPAGASMRDIVALLEAGGADARWRMVFAIGQRGVSVRITDMLSREAAPLGGPLEDAGTAAAIERVIGSDSSVEFRVTVPEGLTAWQVVEGLNRVPFLEGELTEIPAEGSLAPDTFAFRRGARRQALLDEMARAQARILAEAWEKRRADLPLASPQEALILASIVEKETALPEERPIVASVFINRLRRGMRLETDPTIIYGILRGRGTFDREITVSDRNGVTERRLHGAVLYNTYQIDGLPPTPIANPGRASIEAVVNPAETRFLFFVADGSGGHAFAETLAEHQANVARWRRLRSERSD